MNKKVYKYSAMIITAKALKKSDDSLILLSKAITGLKEHTDKNRKVKLDDHKDVLTSKGFMTVAGNENLTKAPFEQFPEFLDEVRCRPLAVDMTILGDDRLVIYIPAVSEYDYDMIADVDNTRSSEFIQKHLMALVNILFEDLIVDIKIQEALSTDCEKDMREAMIFVEVQDNEEAV